MCLPVNAVRLHIVQISSMRFYQAYLILHGGNEHYVNGWVHKHIFVERFKNNTVIVVQMQMHRN